MSRHQEIWTRVNDTLSSVWPENGEPDLRLIGSFVADDLEKIGVYVDNEQVADYIAGIDGWATDGVHALTDGLAEAIEEDLDEEDE